MQKEMFFIDTDIDWIFLLYRRYNILRFPTFPFVLPNILKKLAIATISSAFRRIVRGCIFIITYLSILFVVRFFLCINSCCHAAQTGRNGRMVGKKTPISIFYFS